MRAGKDYAKVTGGDTMFQALTPDPVRPLR